jgi:hypothetical protein
MILLGKLGNRIAFLLAILVSLFGSFLASDGGISFFDFWLYAFLLFGFGVCWLVIFGMQFARLKVQQGVLYYLVPVVLFAGIVLMCSGLPGYLRFRMSEPALTAAAERALAGEEIASGYIGLMPVDHISLDSGTMVRFSTEWSPVFAEYGLIYAPQADPQQLLESGIYRHLRGPWYRYHIPD